MKKRKRTLKIVLPKKTWKKVCKLAERKGMVAPELVWRTFESAELKRKIGYRT